MKNVHRVSTKQRGDMKSSVLWSKNATFSQARCAIALSCSNMWKSSYIHRHVNAIAFRVFVAATVKFVISEPVFHHCSRVATDSTSWDLQACTRDTLWRHCYVTTSKNI